VHEKYDNESLGNDVALIELLLPVEFSRKYLYVLHTLYMLQHLESLALVVWYFQSIRLKSMKGNIPGLPSL